MKRIDEMLDSRPVDSGEETIDSMLDRNRPKSSLLRRGADYLVTGLKGAVGVPEAAVGIADILTGGQAGKLAEDIGFRPKEAKSIIDQWYSPEQQAANKAVQEAQGFVPTLTTALQNPSTIAHSVVESAPSILAGGAVARGATLIPKVTPVIASAIGEGAVSAGQTAEQIRQESQGGTLTPTQAAIAAGSGALTGALTGAGGAVAKKLGISDIDTLVAGGKAASGSSKGLARRAAEGFVSEGILEELPQSLQEQAAQNIAQGKPWDEGLGNAAAMGMLAGGIMGVGGGVIRGKPAAAESPPTQPAPTIADVPLPEIQRGTMLPNEGPQLPTPKVPGKDTGGAFPDLFETPPPAGPEIESQPQRGDFPPLNVAGPQQDRPLPELHETPEEAARLAQVIARMDAGGRSYDLETAQRNALVAREKGTDVRVVPTESGKFTLLPVRWLSEARQNAYADLQPAAKEKRRPEPAGPLALPGPDTPLPGQFIANPDGTVRQATIGDRMDSALRVKHAEAEQQARQAAAVESGLTADVQRAIAARANTVHAVNVQTGHTVEIDKTAGPISAAAGAAIEAGASPTHATPKTILSNPEITLPPATEQAGKDRNQKSNALAISVSTPATQPTQAKEKTDAKQQQEAGKDDGGSRPQSGVRQEGGNPPAGGARVQSGGRQQGEGEKAAEEVLKPESGAERAYDKVRATLLATRMTAQGLPSRVVPHPTQPGKYAIEPGEEPKESPQPASKSERKPEKTFKPERRKDASQRKTVDQMSPEDMRRELLTNHLTGIANKRAYDESKKLPVQVSIDADSLKWVNDTLGHASGDEMLRAIAQALAAETPNAYHVSGDEFIVQALNVAGAELVMKRAADRLTRAKVSVSKPDGTEITLNGLGFSYGTGSTLEEAETGLQSHKAARTQSGERAARGENPPGAVFRTRDRQGLEDHQDHPAGQVTPPEKLTAVPEKVANPPETSANPPEKLTAAPRKPGNVPGLPGRAKALRDLGVQPEQIKQAVDEARAGDLTLLEDLERINAPTALRNAEGMSEDQALQALQDGERLSRYGDTTWIEEIKSAKVQTYVVKTKSESGGITTIGPVGPDKQWGWGRLDAAQRAIQGWVFAAKPAPEDTQAAQDDGLDAMFDQIVTETEPTAKPNPPPAKKPETKKPVTPQIAAPTGSTPLGVKPAAPSPRAASDSAKSAAKNAGAGLADVAKALNALFKPKPGQMNMGLGFDEDTYAQAKPIFLSGIAHFRDAASDIGDMMRALVNAMRTQFGMDTATINVMKPYVLRFIRDVRDGRIIQDDYAPPKEGATNGPESNAGQQPGNVDVRQLGEEGAQEAGGSGRGLHNPAAAANPQGMGSETAANAGPAQQGGGGAETGGRSAGPDVAGGAGVPRLGDAAVGREGAGGTGVAVDGTRRSFGNYHIADPKAIFGGGPKARFNKNRAAIEAFREITEEGKTPTQADRDAMASYTGWGSFGQELFQGNWTYPRPASGWEKEDAWLREHLGKDEWESAQRSILNAHYTDPPTVQAIWDMVSAMGFTGGRILEPSIGIGNFFGLMPRDIMARSQLAGIELDTLTGGMAKLLYPEANIQIKGYQDSKTADGFYDLIVGNWPFAKDTSFVDRRYKNLSPSLHDYFFLKALDQVRAGGLVVGITSNGTMDKVGTSTRLELAKKADLVAAFRLPTGAFQEYAGTKVVTDIIILKKRDKPNLSAGMEPWIVSEPRPTADGEPIRVNKYWTDHPDHVLGDMTWGHGTTTGRPGMIVNRLPDFPQKLADLHKKLPADTFSPVPPSKKINYVTNNTKDRQQSVTVDKGALMVVQGEYLAQLHEIDEYRLKDAKKTAKREAQIRALVEMRRDYGRLIDAERAGSAETETLRKALNSSYQSFVKQHGNVNGSEGLKVLFKVGDPFYASLSALEIKRDGKFSPAAILTRPTMRAKAALTNPSVRDAFVLARNESLNVEPSRIAALAGKPEEAVIRELTEAGALFRTPDGTYAVSDVYLSGNVRRKLQEAKEAQQQGQDMARNIAALEKVIPPTIPYYKIEAKLGAPWISPSQYEEFIHGLLNLTNDRERAAVKVTFRLGSWNVEIDDRSILSKPEAQTVHGVPFYPFNKLVKAAMNNTAITIRVKDEDGNLVVSDTLTEKANIAKAALRDKFSGWIWGETDRRLKAERDYNETMNAIADTKFDGSFLTLEGMALQRGNDPLNLRSHQVNATWRGLVNRMGIYAHEVGTGKTYTMGALAVESRRYGIAKKPLLFAHNANSSTVAREISEMYPAAKVLYVDNLDANRIDVTMRQIANDDWDVVVVPHSLIERLALSENTMREIAADEIAGLEEAAIEAALADNVTLSVADMDDEKAMNKKRSPTAKELVKARNNILKNIAEMAQRSSKEGAVPFEELGVDMILVDEVHEFKKPPLVTRMKMKGLNTGTSNQSIALRFLTDHVKRLNGGTGVHVFTGTPITNTLGEIYNLQRYVADAQMARDGIKDWDSWFNTFADSVTDVELTSTGDYEPVTRLAAFVNTADLRRMIGSYTDIVFADEMPEFKPRETASGKTLADKTLTDEERNQLVAGRSENPVGRPYKKTVNDVGQMSPEQEAMLQMLAERAARFKNAGKRDRRQMSLAGNWSIPIVVETDAAKAGLDPRLFDMSAPDHPNLKINRAAKNILHHYAEHPLSTQAVFVEKGFNSRAERTVRDASGNAMRGPDRKNVTVVEDTFNLVQALIEKLVAGGIPEKQIAVVSGKTTRERRKQIADAMNRSEIRVVIGNTQTLGVGVNMQSELRAMHHLDAPWMPGELEQRNGRGWRQGNHWNTVLEYRYITDRIDGRRWQVLAVKDRFTKDFLHADADTRVIEGDATSMDDDEGAGIIATLSEAAGDPRLLLRHKLRIDVERLENRKRMHDYAKRDAANRIGGVTKQAEQTRQHYADTLDDATHVAQTADKPFSAKLLGKTYTERAEMNNALADWVKTIQVSSQFARIGEISGFSINARWPHMSAPLEVEIRRKAEYKVKATVASMEAIMRSIKTHAAKFLEQAESLEGSIPALKEAAQAPFQREADLQKKQQLRDQLEADIAANPTPPPPWLRQGAPVNTKVYIDGQPYAVEGHQYSDDGFFLIVDTPDGMRRLPYDKAFDQFGMPLYEPHPFAKPPDKSGVIEVGTMLIHAGAGYEALRRPQPVSGQIGRLTVLAKKVDDESVHELDAAKVEIVPLPKPRAIPLFGAKTREASLFDALKKAGESMPQSPREALMMAEQSGALPGESKLFAQSLSSDDAALGAAQAGNATQRMDGLLLSLVAQGKPTSEILAAIAKGSRNPFYRLVASRLSAIGADAKITMGGTAGLNFAVKGISAEKFAASYRPKSNTVTIHKPRDLERNLIHELMHAATYRALRGKSLAASQMKGLFDHVKADGRLNRLYGMSNVDEFVAEAFSNPQFQQALRLAKAPRQVGKIRSAWDSFVNLVRRILGLNERMHDALSEALSIGARLMQETATNPAGALRPADVMGNIEATDDLRTRATNAASDLLTSAESFNWLNRTINTQYHKAQKDPQHFGRVFEMGQKFIETISRAASRPADLAPTLLPKLENARAALKGLFGGTKTNAALNGLAPAVFSDDLRDPNAHVWSDAELREKFRLTDEQIGLYREFRRAVDASLDELAAAESWKAIRWYVPEDVRDAAKERVLSAPGSARDVLHSIVDQAIEAQPSEEKRAVIAGKHGTIDDTFNRADELKRAGYAPRMRFGRYTVTVVDVDADGKPAKDESGEPRAPRYFSMFESEREANSMARRLRSTFQGERVSVVSGVASEQQFKLYRGISPETVGMFAKVLAKHANPDQRDQLRKTYDAWRALAFNNHSTIKRMIQRKGIAGFGEDVPRVLASFLTSNARRAASAYHADDISETVDAIPKERGDVKDEAIALSDAVLNPEGRAPGVRNFLFFQYLGGSIAAAAVNMTQPIMMTLPYLAQYVGARKATALLASAARQMFKVDNVQLAQALRQASQEGIVEPQEIHYLYAQSIRGGLISKLPGGMAHRAQSFLKLWGAPFAIAEKINRRMTFIAAWNAAIERGEADPFAFAKRAVEETQGIYNAGNANNLSRTAIGSVAMTFRQYSIAYLEMLTRMWKAGPEGKKAALLALAIMAMAGGAGGMPFAEDLDDLIDTLGQAFGYDTNAKRWKEKMAAEVLGKEVSPLVLHGLSPYLPIDIQGRLGMGNLLPATSILKKSENAKDAQLLEVLGPVGGVAQSYLQGAEAALSGDYLKALRAAVMPKAFKDIAQGADMMETGMYRDTRGRKVIETGPVDAFSKAIGFQPSEVAGVQRGTRIVQQDIALQKKTAMEIADQKAQAIIEKDPELAAKAARQLAKWNADNPEMPISISPQQVLSRVKAALLTKEERMVKTAPPAMRARVFNELQR